jgi:hypothetical protein
MFACLRMSTSTHLGRIQSRVRAQSGKETVEVRVAERLAARRDRAQIHKVDLRFAKSALLHATLASIQLNAQGHLVARQDHNQEEGYALSGGGQSRPQPGRRRGRRFRAQAAPKVGSKA